MVHSLPQQYPCPLSTSSSMSSRMLTRCCFMRCASSRLLRCIMVSAPCLLHLLILPFFNFMQHAAIVWLHIVQVRVHVGKELARALQPELQAVVAANEDSPGEAYSPEAPAAARRAAKNKALSYLSMLGDAAITANLLHRFQTAQNMTDQIAVLAALNETPGPPVMLAVRFARPKPHASHFCSMTHGLPG